MRWSLIRVVYCVFLLATSFVTSNATWKAIDNRRISAFDMATTKKGLVAINDGTLLVAKYNNGSIDGLYTPNGIVTSIIIRDTNIAYFSVLGDGIYEASARWTVFTKIRDANRCDMLLVYGTTLVAMIEQKIYYSHDGITFNPSVGIDASDSISAVEAYSSSTLIATADSVIYRSLDGGITWTKALTKISSIWSLYSDHANKIMYAGGSQLLQSIDSGATWKPLSSIFFDLTGPVVGTRDCSGVFYLGAYSHPVRGELLRSVNFGKFFQDVGPAYLSLIHLRKGVVLDRGSTVFWLDSGGVFSVSHDGVDSVISDNVRDRVAIGIDTILHNSLCTNAVISSATLRIRYDQCTGIWLDSLKQVEINSAFKLNFTPQFVSDSEIKISYSFRATHEGEDSVRYRLRFHSPITGNLESLIFTLRGIGDGSSAIVSLSQTLLDYGKTGIDSLKKRSITLSNTGCDTLLILDISSSNSALFQNSSKAVPIKLLPGENTLVTISFTPHVEGDYLESITVVTSVGTRFITVRGSASKNGSGDTLDAVRAHTSPTYQLFPNPANNTLSISNLSAIPSRVISCYDILGRLYNPQIVFSDNTNTTLDISPLPPGKYVLCIDAQHIRSTFIRY